MAAHSRTLAWEIPWTEEPGRLQFIELQKLAANQQQIRSASFHEALWSLLCNFAEHDDLGEHMSHYSKITCNMLKILKGFVNTLFFINILPHGFSLH